MNAEDEIRRGQEAARLLAEPLLVEAFKRVENDILMIWRNTAPLAATEREFAWVMLRALDRVRGDLKTIVETGVLASHQKKEYKPS